MGTNYYAIQSGCPSPCEHCTIDEVHIGKSLVMFEAHETSPWGAIYSWSDWKRIFATQQVRIRDEYGQSHDVDDFVRRVEATHPEHRRRQYDWVITHLGTAVDDYLDSDGFSWCRREFS